MGLVHRLDRNVSGVVVTAKTSKAASRLARLFRERDEALEKRYLAWVTGVPPEPQRRAALAPRCAWGASRGRWTKAARRARRARRISLWQRRGFGAKAARLEVRLQTGVTHQIRAQLAAAGHPILGDVKYGGPKGPRVALHAWRVAFPHPVGGARTEVVRACARRSRPLDRRLRLEPPVDARRGRVRAAQPPERAS